MSDFNKEFEDDRSPIDENDIIDVSCLDFDDIDCWLYIPQPSTTSTVEDRITWLRKEPDTIQQNFEATPKGIDTRTFTRPKKQISRQSLKSTFEVGDLSSQNVWKSEDVGLPNITSTATVYNKPETINSTISNYKEAVIPSFLKTVSVNVDSVLQDQNAMSVQRSLDAFLNMCNCKGIDSFVSLTGLASNDSIMNISEPSILYSSIISLPREDVNSMGQRSPDAVLNMSDCKGIDSVVNVGSESNDTLINLSEPSILYSSVISPQREDINSMDNDGVTRSTKLTCPVSETTSKINTTDRSSNINETVDLNRYSTFRSQFSFCHQSTPKNLERISPILKIRNTKLLTSNSTTCQNVKPFSSLRRELLAEVQRNEGSDEMLIHSGTENEEACNLAETQTISDRIKIQDTTVNINTNIMSQNDQINRKYYTFTKKSAAHEKKEKLNAKYMEDKDVTFTKPLPNFRKKDSSTSQLSSKLPRFLRKSNPNLVSNSRKTIKMTSRMAATNMTYRKESNSKHCTIGKRKSGSEERLFELNRNPSDFQVLVTAGSTESIESTRSAHSAPDLDDRLSVCSDSSQNFYTVAPYNLEELHHIVRMQEASLKEESAFQLNREILKNTWIDGKADSVGNMSRTSVIDCESESPFLNIEHIVKTSTPLPSPARSSQPSNVDSDQPVETIPLQVNDTLTMPKVEAVVKSPERLNCKTRMRPPTNFNMGNRAAIATSSIPRPPMATQSRIPMPRFARPGLKGMQSEAKRG